jgi:hypothetical protein
MPYEKRQTKEPISNKVNAGEDSNRRTMNNIRAEGLSVCPFSYRLHVLLTVGPAGLGSSRKAV